MHPFIETQKTWLRTDLPPFRAPDATAGQHDLPGLDAQPAQLVDTVTERKRRAFDTRAQQVFGALKKVMPQLAGASDSFGWKHPVPCKKNAAKKAANGCLGAIF